MSKWIRKDDKVVVTSGNDKGRVGKVLSRNGDRIIVQGVNVRKKHMKRTSQEARAEIVEIERSIHISNVRACNEAEKPVRLKTKVNGSGAKELYYLDAGKEVIVREIAKAKK